MLHQNNIIINYNQCHMIIKKFVYDFIKLLKSDNLFLNSLLTLSTNENEKAYRRIVYIRFSNQSNESVK